MQDKYLFGSIEMNLSEHFTLEEATASVTAELQGIVNSPPTKVLENMKRAAAELEKIRAKVGPILINSWFRCPKLNQSVGGAFNSAHMTGWAIDMHHGKMDPYQLGKFILGMGLDFDQIIYEYGQWVHISFDPAMRKQVLTKFDGPYRSGWLTKLEYNKTL